LIDILKKLFSNNNNRKQTFSLAAEEEGRVFQPYEKLFQLICDNYALNLKGIHGIKHWVQVYKNTQFLANAYAIRSDVFMLFALLHDSKREDEYEDRDHGIRAAGSIKDYIQDGVVDLSEEDEARLFYACSNHTHADKNNTLYHDLVVQICLDADKLDIGRVGVIPDESHFLTDVAKEHLVSLKNK